MSAQTSQFYNAIRWRKQYQKPLLLDEMRYEGDVKSGWGNMKGQEMASYFWMAGLSGGYPTHGDTFRNNADEETEVRWWAKEGTLMGDSPERIRYFKSVMEQAPVTQMSPELVASNVPKKLSPNLHIFSKPGAHYLAYVAETDQNIELTLTDTKDYTVEVLDTWSMKTLEKSVTKPGPFTYKTTVPYTAVRLYVE